MSGLRTALLAMAAAGVLLVLLGAALPNHPIFEALLIAVGGAFFGVFIAAFVADIANKVFADDIRKTIELALAPGLTSPEKDIVKFREKWHFYHVTRIDGEHRWKYSTVDFSRRNVPGHLFAEATVPDKNARKVLYTLEAGLRDERLVIFFKGEESHEPTAVAIFPTAGNLFQSLHVGFLIHQTWDATHSLSPALLSVDPIFAESSDSLVPAELARELDSKWKTRASTETEFLPRILSRLDGGSTKPPTG